MRLNEICPKTGRCREAALREDAAHGLISITSVKSDDPTDAARRARTASRCTSATSSQTHPTTFSFEFFPPKTDAASDELFANIAQLQELQPSFVSVTYGAGGSTRERTHDLIVRIQRETDLTAVSHLTCVCHTREELAAILDRYAASGIENILALGGDPPRDTAELRPLAATPSSTPTGSSASSSEWPATPTPAASASASPASPRGTPARRTGSRRWTTSSARSTPAPTTSAPSSSSTTDDFYDFRERCELAGIHVPIVAGHHAGHRRRRAWCGWPSSPSAPASRPGCCGAIDRCADDEAVAKVGIHWATEQCRDLLDNNVRGIHFYTLNKSDATRRIYENLGVKDSLALRRALSRPSRR